MPSISPGPNMYELPQIIGAGKHDPRFPYAPAFSLSPRIGAAGTELNPAPNQYEVSEVYRDGRKGAKAFALGGRAGPPGRDFSPGPGQYEPTRAEKVVYPALPTYGFGNKEKIPKLDANPAPGQYDPKTLDSTKTFALRGRPISHNNENSPGPGTYEVSPRIMKDGPLTNRKVTITGRGKDSYGTSNPAPGQYEMEKGFTATRPGLPVFSFKGKGREFSPGDTPGPTAYSPRAPHPTKTFTMGGRDRDGQVSDTPGPGHYDFDNQVLRTGKEGGKIISIKGRPRDGANSNTPGPGSYTPDFSRTKVRPPNYSLGTRMNLRDGSYVPGPGHYDPKDMNGNPAFELRGRPKDSGRDQSPGPGEYQINDKLHYKGKLGGPAYTLGGRDDMLHPNGLPGPGEYQPDDKLTKAKLPAYSFTPRGDWHNGDNTPGPGQYSPRDRNDAQAFNIRGRPKDDQKNLYPGPGQYEVNDRLSKNGKISTPAFTMGKRDDANRNNMYPGPGQYDPKDKKAGPQWSLGTRDQGGKADNIPGPGSYDPRDGKRVNALSMDATGNDKRPWYGNTETPGPGYYRVDNNVYDKTGRKQPAFSMGGRDPQAWGNSSTPGPGQYLHDLDRDGRRTHKGPSYSMGARGKDMTSENPGPGYYDPDPMIGDTVRSTKPRAPQVSIHKRDLQTSTDMTPGPGQYETIDASNYKTKPPAFSMGLKNRDGDVNLSPRLNTQRTPAPA